MRAPLSWIRDFTPLDDLGVPEIADALNQLGLEVEEIDAPGRDVNGVVVARILDVVPHPDADRIRLADIDFGEGQIRVVCGAPNIEPGMVVPFARVGAVLPGDFTEANGYLTPSLKLKRNVVMKDFGDEVEKLYA